MASAVDLTQLAIANGVPYPSADNAELLLIGMAFDSDGHPLPDAYALQRSEKYVNRFEMHWVRSARAAFYQDTGGAPHSTALHFQLGQRSSCWVAPGFHAVSYDHDEPIDEGRILAELPVGLDLYHDPDNNYQWCDHCDEWRPERADGYCDHMIYCEECCEPVVIDRPCEHSIVCDGQLLGPESIPWDHYMPKVTAVGIRSLLADQLREAYAAECEVNHER